MEIHYTVGMKNLVFEWDNTKAKKNLEKHRVAFEEAQSVFFDDYAVQFWDENHSDNEQRFLMLGMSNKIRILLVVHCFKEDESTIRIISARKATKKEKVDYP